MIYPITKFGSPVLEMPTEPITEFGRDLAEIIENLFETMYTAQGIGLAAPQVGLGRRVAVIDLSCNEDPDAKIALVNPEIVQTRGHQTSREGCLSVPGIFENVRRPRTITVRAQDVHGNWFERSCDDLLARAILHETDHLDGILFFSRISGLKRGLIKRRIEALINADAW